MVPGSLARSWLLHTLECALCPQPLYVLLPLAPRSWLMLTLSLASVCKMYPSHECDAQSALIVRVLTRKEVSVLWEGNTRTAR